MKKLFFCLCIFCSLLCYGQNKTNLTIHQDLRMLFVGDERGNGIFTPDLLVKFEAETFRFKNSSIYLYIGAEYADLTGSPFQRFLVGLGYIVEFPFLEKFNFGVLLDHGLILRTDGNFMGMSANFEASYPVARKLRLSLLYQAIDRNDLTNMFHQDKNIKGSVFIGAKIAL